MSLKKIAVIGAGNSGYTMAAALTLAGHKVNLYDMPRFKNNLDPVIERGGIELSLVSGLAGRQGFARMDVVTTEIAEAIKGARLIMVTTTTAGQECVAELCAPHLEDGQNIVMPAGHGGSLLFAKIIKRKARNKNVKIAETSSCFFACRRVVSEAKTVIFFYGGGLKKLPISAIPTADTDKVIDELDGVCPVPLLKGTNVLEVGLSTPNVFTHVPGSILNTGWIEATKGRFDMWRDATTPSVLRVYKAVSRERGAIFSAAGWTDRYSFDHFEKTLPNLYGLSGHEHLRTRYITEDVPDGLVCLASLGDMLKVPVPVIKSLITLASEINQTDYFKEGRTMERFGIAGLSADELNHLLNRGVI